MPRTPRKTAPRVRKRNAKPKLDPAQAITEEIIALLEAGTVPWQQPWFSVGPPLRHESTPYRGINAFLLGMRAGLVGHGSPYWLTFKQAKDLGACVRKGERSSLVVYYGTARAKEVDGKAFSPGDRSRFDEGGDAIVVGDTEGSSHRFLKSYRVFNADQVDGLDPRFYPKPATTDMDTPDPLPRWERFFAAIGEGAGVPTDFGGDRACYTPALDRIDMPALARFVSASQFYSTWWHELTHATRVTGRLDRSFGASRFGNEAYAREEAVACLSQCLADQLMGFGTAHLDNHAAYLDGWISVLKNDRRFLFTAAAHAQRAVDWLVAAAARGGVSLEEDDAPDAGDAALGAMADAQQEAA
ncbi:MAG: ArdC family protein [Shimia sp.]